MIEVPLQPLKRLISNDNRCPRQLHGILKYEPLQFVERRIHFKIMEAL